MAEPLEGASSVGTPGNKVDIPAELDPSRSSDNVGVSSHTSVGVSVCASACAGVALQSPVDVYPSVSVGVSPRSPTSVNSSMSVGSIFGGGSVLTGLTKLSLSSLIKCSPSGGVIPARSENDFNAVVSSGPGVELVAMTSSGFKGGSVDSLGVSPQSGGECVDPCGSSVGLSGHVPLSPNTFSNAYADFLSHSDLPSSQEAFTQLHIGSNGTRCSPDYLCHYHGFIDCLLSALGVGEQPVMLLLSNKSGCNVKIICSDDRPSPFTSPDHNMSPDFGSFSPDTDVPPMSNCRKSPTFFPVPHPPAFAGGVPSSWVINPAALSNNVPSHFVINPAALSGRVPPPLNLCSLHTHSVGSSNSPKTSSSGQWEGFCSSDASTPYCHLPPTPEFYQEAGSSPGCMSMSSETAVSNMSIDFSPSPSSSNSSGVCPEIIIVSSESSDSNASSSSGNSLPNHPP